MGVVLKGAEVPVDLDEDVLEDVVGVFGGVGAGPDVAAERGC